MIAYTDILLLLGVLVLGAILSVLWVTVSVSTVLSVMAGTLLGTLLLAVLRP